MPSCILGVSTRGIFCEATCREPRFSFNTYQPPLRLVLLSRTATTPTLRLGLYLLLILPLVLLGCEDTPVDPLPDPDPDPDPSVSVTADFTVDPADPETGDEVVLDGSASSVTGADELSFVWELSAPAGSEAVIDDPEAESTSFTADVEGTYEITLEVSSGDAIDSTSESVEAIDPAPDVVEISSDITEDRTLNAETLYRVTSTIDVEAVLTIEPGTRIEFEEGTWFRFRDSAVIIADGTEAEPITFTGTQESPGWWNGLWIRETDHPDNIINHAVIEYGGGSSFSSSVEAANLAVGRLSDRAAVTVTNTTIQHSGAWGLFSTRASNLPGFEANTISQNQGMPVRSGANNAHFFDGASTFIGNDEDYVFLRSAEIDEEDVTWQKLDVPYRMDGETRVEEVALTVNPGATIAFEQGAELQFREGSIIQVEGTADDPILFTGTLEQPGWWSGIWVRDSDHPASVIDHAIIEYAGRSDFSSSVEAANLAVGRLSSAASVAITNTTIRHSDSYGLFSTEASSLTGFANNTLTQNAGMPVRSRVTNAHYFDEGSTFTGNGEDYVYLRSTTIDEEDVTWQKLDVPYRMEGQTRVEDVELSIDPGAVLAFEQDASLRFDPGSIVDVRGTAEEPIVFTGTVAEAGWWRGIWISESDHPDNVIDHAVIEHGGRASFSSSVEAGNLVVGRLSRAASVTVTNSLIQDSGDWGFWATSDATVNSDVCSVNEFINNGCTIDD